MSEHDDSRTARDRDRRLFLEKAGRFAAVTPPVVALMLSATDRARAAAASGLTTLTTTASLTNNGILYDNRVLHDNRVHYDHHHRDGVLVVWPLLRGSSKS